MCSRADPDDTYPDRNLLARPVFSEMQLPSGPVIVPDSFVSSRVLPCWS
jgi:hypothetical protein